MKQVKDLTVSSVYLLLDVQALLAHNYTAGVYSRDSEGKSVSPDSSEACSFCTIGGVYRTALTHGLVESVSTTRKMTAELLTGCLETADLMEVIAGYILEEYPDRYTASFRHAVIEGAGTAQERLERYCQTIISFNDTTQNTADVPQDRVHKMMDDLVAQIVYADIKVFFQKWLDWAEDGGHGDLFDNSRGLCQAYLHTEWEDEKPLDKKALRMLLDKEFGPTEYPFGGKDQYALEHLEDTTHKNEARLAWVRRQLQED